MSAMAIHERAVRALRLLVSQVDGYLEAEADVTCPVSLLAQRRRVLRAAAHAGGEVWREAERSLSVSPEAIDREMARARRPDQPLPSHAVTVNGRGPDVTLQPGAEPQ